ncbi:MAG: TAXI family TRAP transporter solute-binding subunit [Firmicutes bacterium]|nr:TAXI family TRAP transporter solute-binding subunit [Bacillota bacterium]
MFKTNRMLMILMALVLMGALIVGCTPADGNGDEGEVEAETIFISIATGGTGGVYYPLGGAMAKIFNENIEGANANAEATGASIANIQLVEDGDAQLALIQNDISYYAYEGIEMYEDKGKQESVRGMATVYPETIQIVAHGDSGIESVEDMVGKKVAVGDVGSGTEANARQILAAHGITYDDITPDYLSFAEAADNLRDGHIDAAFITAGFPTAAITEITQVSDVKIVPVAQDIVDALKVDYPFYTGVEIPAGTYRGQDDDVNTVAVMAMLVVPADMDEELAYSMTKALFENLDVLAAAHDRGADLKLESALDGMSLPLHPGVQKYFDEVM